jgi:hypothetical protein
MEDLLHHIKTASVELQAQIDTERESGTRVKVGQLRARLARNESDKDKVSKALAKARKQREILDARNDFEGLLFALTAFKNLQQIRFMRVADETDAGWIKFLKTHPEYESRLGPFDWNIAWEHSAKTLTDALVKSKCQTVVRLSSRFFEPNAPCEYLNKHKSFPTLEDSGQVEILMRISNYRSVGHALILDDSTCKSKTRLGNLQYGKAFDEFGTRIGGRISRLIEAISTYFYGGH